MQPRFALLVTVIVAALAGSVAVFGQASPWQPPNEAGEGQTPIMAVHQEPGEKTETHQHTAPVVVLQDSAGKAIATGPMRFEFNEPGQWGFFDAGSRHEIANAGDSRVELIEVEVRRR
jgi:hypothetical protein